MSKWSTVPLLLQNLNSSGCGKYGCSSTVNWKKNTRITNELTTFWMKTMKRKYTQKSCTSHIFRQPMPLKGFTTKQPEVQNTYGNHNYSGLKKWSKTFLKFFFPFLSSNCRMCSIKSKGLHETKWDKQEEHPFLIAFLYSVNIHLFLFLAIFCDVYFVTSIPWLQAGNILTSPSKRSVIFLMVKFEIPMALQRPCSTSFSMACQDDIKFLWLLYKCTHD